jgi:DNA-binding CsgD family transcriptional regulator
MYSAEIKEIVLILIFIIVVVSSGTDLVADLSHGATTDHIIKETIVVSISILSIAWLLIGLHNQRLEINALKQELEPVASPQESPRKYVLDERKKLRDVVTQQFSEWELTDSEINIGWLLLKGFSLKEIAMLRNTVEKTVRQQASSIYQKTGISGRHAFSAWFIEDIL